MHRMRPSAATIIAALAVVVVSLGTYVASTTLAQKDAAKPTFMLNLTSGQEDLHAAWMGLRLAEYAVDAHRDVVVFLNVRGAEFSRADLSDAIRYREELPIGKMLQELLSRGATVYVCPHCMGSCGIEEQSLAPGIKVAGPHLFDHLKADAVVFSY